MKLAPVWVSVALLRSVVMALPAALDLLPGLATDTAPVIDQVKLAEPELPRLSVAVRVTLEDPEVVGVPVMAPVALLSVSPVGSPVADQVRVVPEDDVGGAIGQRRDGAARGAHWAPGLVTATAPTTVQLKLAEPELPEPSVAVRVTLEVPATVGVPVMAPARADGQPGGQAGGRPGEGWPRSGCRWRY